QHALELGARAGVTDVSIVNTLVILRLLVQDLEDGIFDGQQSGVALNVVGNVFIDKETTRLSLAKAIDAWLDSDHNKTGLTTRARVSPSSNARHPTTGVERRPSRSPVRPILTARLLRRAPKTRCKTGRRPSTRTPTSMKRRRGAQTLRCPSQTLPAWLQPRT